MSHRYTFPPLCCSGWVFGHSGEEAAQDTLPLTSPLPRSAWSAGDRGPGQGQRRGRPATALFSWEKMRPPPSPPAGQSHRRALGGVQLLSWHLPGHAFLFSSLLTSVVRSLPVCLGKSSSVSCFHPLSAQSDLGEQCHLPSLGVPSTTGPSRGGEAQKQPGPFKLSAALGVSGWSARTFLLLPREAGAILGVHPTRAPGPPGTPDIGSPHTPQTPRPVPSASSVPSADCVQSAV